MTISCQKRQRKNGAVFRYVVKVRKKHFSAIESLTFPDKASGRAWAKAVEKDMLDQATKAEQEEVKYESARSRTGDITLKDYLVAYREKMESLPEKKQISYRDMLAVKFWERSWLAKKRSKEITGQDLIDLLDERLATVTPSTNHLYVSVLRRAIGWQRRVGLHFKRFISDELMKELWKLDLVGKSQEDDTRPTEHQVYQLYKEFLSSFNRYYATVPYHDLMMFSIYSAFRQGEICNIRYSDLDVEHGEVIVRDRKDPRKKYGNHQKVPLCSVCLEIIARQPRRQGEDRIFPYKQKTVSVKFSERTKRLGFPELRFHSFRHEGISRFFEQKMSIPEVAVRSGHKTWDNLRRYTHLINRTPPDLWAGCKEIDREFLSKNKIINPHLNHLLEGAGHYNTP